MKLRTTCLTLTFAVFLAGLVAVLAQNGNTRDISIVPITQKRAVLIGVNEYNSLRNLEFAVADTVALRDRLIDIGFLREQISCLVTGAEVEAKNLPTKNNIENQVELTAKNANAGDLIILALSGHGVKGKSGKSYFCPSDTNNMSAETIEKSCVSIDWIYETLNKSEAKFKLILVDACRNDPFEGRVRGDEDVVGLQGFLNPPDGIILLQSCEEGTYSYEDEEIGQGIFTYTLIQGLNGQADVNKSGSIGMMDLLTYTMRETNNYVSKRFRKSQKPRLSGSTGDFEIVNLGNLSVSEREKAEGFYEEAMTLRKDRKYEDALHKINLAVKINPRSEAYFNERATILQFLVEKTNVTSGSDRYERPKVTTTDPLQRALEEVIISKNRRDDLEKERLTILEDYPPTHVKVKAIEKQILAEGVLYASYVDQANIHFGTEIEIKTNLIKEHLAQGMREDARTIWDLKALIEKLTEQRKDYVNAFHPETYEDCTKLFPEFDMLRFVPREVIDIKGIEYAFRWCPPGTFMMGSPESEEGQHQVTLTKGFWMLETQVTQEMWESVMGDNPSNSKEGLRGIGLRFVNPKFPVNKVAWSDCQNFVSKLNMLKVTPAGFKFSLPTEAQWEYACRAGTTTPFNFGSVWDVNLARDTAGTKEGTDGTKGPVHVGSYPTNAWGLYDMHGNGSEFCMDVYGKYPEGPVTDPVGPTTGEAHVTRGHATSASRNYMHQVMPWDYHTGLRLVLVSDNQSQTKVEQPPIAPSVVEQQPAVQQPVTPPSVQPQISSPVIQGSEGTYTGERQVLTIKDVEYAFRWCPPGTFMMGSPESEGYFRKDNETQHRVTLTQGFWMQETQVTQEMWESVMGNNPSSFKASKRLPVENVSWNDCQKFIRQMNLLGVAPSGYKFSLPTEAQWEYACRAGTTSPFHFGSSLLENNGRTITIWANYNDYKKKTLEVSSFTKNAWGLYDMHGNVWEWCLDWYGTYPEDSVADPVGPPTGSFRVRRGGGWRSTAGDCRSAYRSYRDPSDRGDYNDGFRLAMVSDHQTQAEVEQPSMTPSVVEQQPVIQQPEPVVEPPVIPPPPVELQVTESALTPAMKRQVLADYQKLAECVAKHQGTYDYMKEHYQACWSEWKTAAEEGMPEAQLLYGLCLNTYLDGEKDEEEAVKWFRKAAEQGVAIAQLELGDCYNSGTSVNRDSYEAVKWYRKAAEQDIHCAQTNLGWCYASGDGVTQDYAEAIKWYLKGAVGCSTAQKNLGYCYYEGKGVAQNFTEALKWFRKAAEDDNCCALAAIGKIYYYGHGVTRDYTEAVKWFGKAEEQGHTLDQEELNLLEGNNAQTLFRQLDAPKITRYEWGRNKIGIRWTPVNNAGSYKIEYTTDSNFNSRIRTVTVNASTTSREITGLGTYTTYYVRVKALGTGFTDSGYSNSVWIRTPR